MMLGVAKVAVLGAMLFTIGRGPVVDPAQLPVVEELASQSVLMDATVLEEVAPAEAEQKGILDEYIGGVLGDTDQYTGELGAIIGEFVEDAQSIVEDMIENPDTTPEDMAEEMEKRAEQFADELENVSEIYGHLQEIAGEAFGEKFDKDTAESVLNVIGNIFGRR